VLRHTGIRVEELVELTHPSVRQYQPANGEINAAAGGRSRRGLKVVRIVEGVQQVP
jgi:hypothetical protein